MEPTRTPIPARTGWSARLKEGQSFSVIDVEGGQAADLFAFNAENTDEFLSAQHTRVAEGRIYPEVGWTFVTNERRPMLEFTADTSPGRHDCLAAACDKARYIQLGGARTMAPARRTSSPRPDARIEIATPPSRSTCSRTSASIRRTAAFDLEPCVSKPGDAATLQGADGLRRRPLRLSPGHRGLSAGRSDRHGGGAVGLGDR